MSLEAGFHIIKEVVCVCIYIYICFFLGGSISINSWATLHPQARKADAAAKLEALESADVQEEEVEVRRCFSNGRDPRNLGITILIIPSTKKKQDDTYKIRKSHHLYSNS